MVSRDLLGGAIGEGGRGSEERGGRVTETVRRGDAANGNAMGRGKASN